MSLKVFVADDSMTAQNMARKILTDSGYDVTTVSNGAAAIKKIAEIKPDIIILDIYMPGYTGLEVCEKVKNALETSKVPVLLTVGKMEPFRQEDAQKVKADAVIIKPFEATDLTAVVGKLAEKLQPQAPAVPDYEKTIRLTPQQVEEFKDASYEQWKTDTEAPPETAPTQVPQEMSVAPAIPLASEQPAVPSLDDTVAVGWNPAQAAAAAAIPSFDAVPNPFEAPAPDPAAIPSFENAVSLGWQPVAPVAPEFSAPAPEAVAPTAPVLDPFAAAMPAPSFDAAAVAPSIDLDFAAPAPAPTFDPAATAAAPSLEIAAPPELEFTSAPQAQDVSVVETAHGFEPTVSQEQFEVQHAVDPALVTDPTEMASAFVTKFGVENPEDIPVAVVSEEVPLAQEASTSDAEQPQATAVDDDFERRVAEAMAAFSAPATEESAPSEFETTENAPDAVSDPVASSFEMPQAAPSFDIDLGLEAAVADSAPSSLDEFLGGPDVPMPEPTPAPEPSPMPDPMPKPEPVPTPTEPSPKLRADETMVMPREAALMLEVEMQRRMAEQQQAEAEPVLEVESAPEAAAPSLRADETMVMPREAAMMLEQEMQRAMQEKQAATAPEEFVLGDGHDLPTPLRDADGHDTPTPLHEEVAAVAPELADAPMPVAEPAPQVEPTVAPNVDHELAAAMAAALSEMQPEFAADATSDEVAATGPAPEMAMAATAAPVRDDKLADAVQRAIERLKPQIIAEIVKELKSE